MSWRTGVRSVQQHGGKPRCGRRWRRRYDSQRSCPPVARDGGRHGAGCVGRHGRWSARGRVNASVQTGNDGTGMARRSQGWPARQARGQARVAVCRTERRYQHAPASGCAPRQTGAQRRKCERSSLAGHAGKRTRVWYHCTRTVSAGGGWRREAKGDHDECGHSGRLAVHGATPRAGGQTSTTHTQRASKVGRGGVQPGAAGREPPDTEVRWCTRGAAASGKGPARWAGSWRTCALQPRRTGWCGVVLVMEERSGV